MKQNIIILFIVLLFISFIGLLIFGTFINNNQFDLQTTVKKIGEKISGVEENVNGIMLTVEENKKIVNQTSFKVDEFSNTYSKDLKTLKNNIQSNTELIKKEKNELNQNYKKLSSMLKNTQNIMYKLDNSVDVLFKNQKLYNSYKSKFEKVNKDIETINQRIALLETKGDLSNDFTGLLSDIDNKFKIVDDRILINDSKINDIERKVNDVYDKLSTYKTNSPNISNDTTSDLSNDKYQAKFNEINQKIDSLFLTLDTKNTGIINEYTKLKEQIDSLQLKIDNLKTDNAVPNNEAEIKNIKTSLEGFQTDINTQLNTIKVTIEELNKKISEIEKK